MDAIIIKGLIYDLFPIINYILLKSIQYIAGMVREGRSSIANALELCLSCTKPSVCGLSVNKSVVIGVMLWRHGFRPGMD